MKKLAAFALLFAICATAAAQPPRPILPRPILPRPLNPVQPRHENSEVGGRTYKSEELAEDLPGAEHMKNIGSKLGDHAGMCVFTSTEMAAIYQGLEQMRGFRDWCAEHYEGGGTPSILAQRIEQYCTAKNIPIPAYHQEETADPGPILDRCDRTNRLACVTYSYSPRYVSPGNPGGRISHMVCAPRGSGNWAAILDNNFPGESHYEWMSLAEQQRRMKFSGKAWIFVWLTPGPPPVPK